MSNQKANGFLSNIPQHLLLMRFDKPIGWLLLMWPTLCALWAASDGKPDASLIWIFVFGVIVMRSAGCVINDIADRNIDPLVERTKNRPLAAGNVTLNQAIFLFILLCLVALVLLVQLPMRVWPWSIPALVITIVYPFMKRIIQAPQLVLGVAFSFGIPMVYVACEREFDAVFWLLVVCNFLWVLMYDTIYAMSDREDDLKIGVKSSAILFGRFDKLIISLLQMGIVMIWIVLMCLLNLSFTFMFSIAIAAGMFAYQQWLISGRERQPCFKAFLNNGWVGGVLWFGLMAAQNQ